MGQKLEIDTDDLPVKDAGELEQLVTKAKLVTNQKEVAAGRPRPDEFHYRIKITESGESHTAITSDSEMPDELKELVDWLTLRAAGRNG